MNEKIFLIEGGIPAMRGEPPIRFVHRRSEDAPENHKLHINTYLELYVFVEGDHRYIVDNKLYDLTRGDVILINPREVHKALPLSCCVYERFYMLLDERCFFGLDCDPMPRLLTMLSSAGNLVSPEPEARKELLELLYGISDGFESKKESGVAALASVMRILDICTRELSRRQPDADGVMTVRYPLDAILAYVADNTAQIRSVSQIADAAGLSPQYLSTYFKSRIGTPLKLYVQAQKIALAKDLLDRGATVTEACFDSGFNDCSYFIKVFKKYTGVTPLRYRGKLRGV